MYCSKCGSEVKDDFKFCGACGAPVAPAPVVASAPASVSAPGSGHMPAPTAVSVQFTQASAQKPAPVVSPAASVSFNHSKFIPALIVALVVALVVGAIIVYQQTTSSDEASVPIEITFALDSTSVPVGIPLHITGTDLDGETVDERMLATSTDTQLRLLRGEYEMAVPTDIICEDGVVFQSSDDSRIIKLDIPEDNNTTAAVLPPIVFTPIPATDVTDDMLDAIRDDLDSVGAETTEVTSAIEKAIEKRQDEFRRKEEEEKRRQQEEMQVALTSNPSKVYGTNMNKNAPSSQLTGVVKYRYCEVGDDSWAKGYVCYLQLPGAVELVGTQYGSMTSSSVILPSGLSGYAGQTVTVTSHFSGRVTASIPEAAISSIWAYDATIVKAWN